MQPESISMEVPGYELVKVIGRGSYGTVYLGQSDSGQWRAVKICRRDDRNLKDLEREWRGLRRYEPVSRSNPGFLGILDLGEDPGGEWFYCVMELADDVAGGAMEDAETYQPRTLAHDLKKRGHLNLPEVVHLGKTLATALGWLHDSGLVHRDVKPANIVYVGGQPKLADLGLVVAEAEANSLVGTPGYIPPEGPGKPAGDIFALGKVLYQALTGYDPTRFPDPPTFLRGHPDPTRFQEVMDVLSKASEERRDKRHATAWEMTEELELIHSGLSVRVLRAARAQRAQWRRRGLAGAVLAAAALVVGLIAHRVSTLDQIERERNLAATTSRSERMIEAGDYGQALVDQAELVRRTEGTPDERLARLRYSMTLGQMPKLTAAGAIEGGVSWCGFLPGDEQVVVAGKEGLIQLRRASDGEIVRQWQAELLRMAAISPSGDWIATTHGATVRLWRAGTGAAGPSLIHPATTEVLAACFHPLEPLLLTLAMDGRLRWWNLSEGSLLRETAAHRKRASALAIHPNGRMIATGGYDNAVRFWNEQGEQVGADLPLPNWIYHLNFSRDGRAVLATCADRNVYVWDADSRRPVAPPMRHTRLVGVAKFSPTGRVVATCGWDGDLRLWNVQTGALEPSILRHRFPILTVGFSSDGRRLATGCKDGLFRVWDLAGKASAERLAPVVSSPGNGWMVVKQSGGDFALRDLAKDNEQVGQVGPLRIPAGFEPIAVNDRGDRVVVARSATRDSGTAVRLLEAETGQSIGPERIYASRSVSCRFLPAGDVLAIVSSNQICLLTTEGSEAWSRTMEERIQSLAFSPEGTWLATAAGTNVVVWEASSGRQEGGVRTHAREVSRMIFNREASRLIVCTSDSSLESASAKVWDLRAGSTQPLEIWHLDGVKDAVWVEPENLFATVSEDGTGRLWNDRTGRPTGETMAHRDQAMSLDLGPAGLLLTASWDCAVRFWDAQTGQAFGPPVPYPYRLASALWIPGGRGFIARQESRTAWRQPLEPLTLPSTNLVRLAAVMAGEVGGEQSSTETAFDLAKAWRELRASHAGLFSAGVNEAASWYQIEAEACQAEGRTEAALMLLDHALVSRPGDARILERKKDFASRLRAGR